MAYDMIIGIDPGKAGGIAYKTKQDTHCVKNPGSVNDLVTYVKHLKTVAKNPICFLEQVQGWRGDSSAARFGIEKLVKQRTEMKTVFLINDIPVIDVHPMTWTSTLKLRGDRTETLTERKNRYKDHAQSAFPSCKMTLWNADAFLILKFAILKMNHDKAWIQERLDNTTGLFK